MSPEEVKEILHHQVYSSALEIVSNRLVLPNHHEVYVQSICGALLGSQWYMCSRGEQQTKKNTIKREYEKLLARYLPVLRRFRRDTNEIFKPDEAFVAKILGNNGDTLGEPASEEILEDGMGESRDQAARRRLGPRYWIYEQYRTDIVQRREEAPGAQHEPIDFKIIPLNEDQKTKTCPICEKNISCHSANRHFREVHSLDPRHAIFCPRCPRSGPVFIVWRGDSSHIDIHLWHSHKTVLNKKDGKETTDKNKGDSKAKATQTAPPEDDEQDAEDSKLTGHHLRVGTPDYEEMEDENLYDEDMHETYQPCLQEHLDETKQLLKQRKPLPSGRIFKPDDASNAQALQSVPENETEKRDREAREILGSKYDTYKQDLPHVVKRRGARKKVSIVPRLDIKNITPNDEGKKKCDVCGKWLTPNALQRHHQQIHAQDVRYAIYCPEKDCDYVEWRGDSTIDDHLLNKHKQVLVKNKTKSGTGTGKTKSMTKNKATKLVSSESRGREADQAEQAEGFQGGDGGEATGDEMVDVSMVDSEMIYEDMAHDSMFVDGTFDEDMGDVPF